MLVVHTSQIKYRAKKMKIKVVGIKVVFFFFNKMNTDRKKFKVPASLYKCRCPINSLVQTDFFVGIWIQIITHTVEFCPRIQILYFWIFRKHEIIL